MTKISWNQFANNQDTKTIVFESFCFQIAYILYKDYGYFENYFNTPGSEFYLKLHSDCKELNLKAGDVIGWQVKWWFDKEDSTSLGKKRKEELIKGFETTLKRHSDISLWIICTPGSFVEDTFIDLKSNLVGLKNIDFLYWNKETFQNQLSDNFNKLGNIFHSYFNLNYISHLTLKSYSERQINYLHSKFNTDLYAPSNYDEEILFTLNYEKLFKEIEIKRTYILDDVERVKDSLSRWDLERYFSTDYLDKVKELYFLIFETLNYIVKELESGLSIDKCISLNLFLEDYHKKYQKITNILNKKISRKEWFLESEQKSNWIHSDFIESIHLLDGYLFSRKDEEEKTSKSIVDLFDLVFKVDMHILSSAGYGKTNIACNIAKSCLDNNIPALLLLGSNFRNGQSPKNAILEQLDLSKDYNFKQFLGGINTLGLIKGHKIPIIIDGLNESKPYDDVWKTNIYNFIEDFKEFEYLCLITTCRDRYIEAIFEKNDLNDIENTFLLEGLNEKQRELAIPKYFEKYNIVPLTWNFNKDIFKHPLILKIFCEANENRENFNITIDNIFESFEKYYKNIIKKVSEKNSKTDKFLQGNIEQRIKKLCFELWNTGSRDIGINRFVEIIAPGSDSFIDTIADKILDEGLCFFQKNLNDDETERVQFSYDMVAGYLITDKVILSNCSNDFELTVKQLKENNIDKMLFSNKSNHELDEDILASLLYLCPKKTGFELFELFENDIIIETCYRNIDYFILNQIGQKKLLDLHSNSSKETNNYSLLFEKLFENIFQKEISGLGDFVLELLSKLNQSEIDIYWSELIRKNSIVVHTLLYKIQDNYKRNKLHKQNPCQDILCSFLSTTSSNKTIRSLATENMFLIAKSYNNEILDLGLKIVKFNDVNSIESFIVALCGSVLSKKDKEFCKRSIEFIENKFIVNFKNTHVCIIDYVFTILEFSNSKFGLIPNKKIKFNKNDFKIEKQSEVVKEIDNNYMFPSFFGMDLYDFKKYQVNSISSDSYYKRTTFSSSECMKIILSNFKNKGYSKEKFSEIDKKFQDDKNYRYVGESNANLTLYQEKYLWQSYFEFVGYLVLTKKIKSENNFRYRTDYNFFDPTFPKLPQRFQLINECFCPSNNENVQNWIDSDYDRFIYKYIKSDLYIKNTEWILLSLDLEQKNENNDTRIHIHLKSFLVPKEKYKTIKKFKRKDFDLDTTSFHDLYAGEINWSPFAKNEVEEDFFHHDLNVIDTMYAYSWSNWTSNRFDNPYFKFLNPEISNTLNLDFNLDDLSFYNEKNEQVTKIVWTESSKLYYIRKDLLDEIIDKLNCVFVLNQFVAKYGEWGIHINNKLRPTYKDLDRLISYNEIT